MQSNNTFILAAAGAGKTTKICRYAHKNPNKRVLYTTYTHENTVQLFDTITSFSGVQPANTSIMSWLSFLLSECIRPYQHFLYPDHRIENLHFVNGQSAPYIKRADTRHFYLSDSTHIFSDKMSDFAYHCNLISGGLIINRLEQMFDVIFIDEAQDISGYDFDFIELLLKSKVNVIMVGDARQKTYSTTHSSKNKSLKILDWFKFMETAGLGTIEYMNQSHRCNEYICRFSDALFPELPATQSLNIQRTGHDGIFFIDSQTLPEYFKQYNPEILVYDRRASQKAGDLPTQNYGAVKGQTFERVLIIPTQKIEQYLSDSNVDAIATVIEKFYVAITRARYSVTFLTTRAPSNPGIKKWECTP